MSSISNLGGGSQAALIQQLKSGQQGRHDRFGQDFVDAAKALGIDSTKAQDVQKQITDALTDLKNQSNGQRPDAKTVRSTIDGILQKNGIDPAAIQKQIRSQHPHHHHHDGGNQNAKQPSSLPGNGTVSATAVDVAA